MKAFEIKANGQVLDYRVSQNLDLDKVRGFFSKKYKILKIWQQSRHVLGILEKNENKLFLKLATTKGISAVTQIDYNWNKEFNNLVSRDANFWVPQNIDSGFYEDDLFYMITDYFNGDLLSKTPHPNTEISNIKDYLNQIVEFSELIQNLNISQLSDKDTKNYSDWFFQKTLSWYEGIPQNIIEEYQVDKLLEIVKTGYKNLDQKPRHGDFTPWHIIKLENNKLGLIDGEHAMRNGVRYYDIAFFIERVFVVLQNISLAQNFYQLLKQRDYDLEKLKTVLASRAIGGFLDCSLYFEKKPDFTFADKFKDWVKNL